MENINFNKKIIKTFGDCILYNLQIPENGNPVVNKKENIQSFRSEEQFFKEKKEGTLFKRLIDRSKLPFYVSHIPGKPTGITWTISIDNLDLEWLFPILINGLQELEYQYAFPCSKAIFHLCLNTNYSKVIYKLIKPLKSILNHENPQVISRGLYTLQILATAEPESGKTLVPYYRYLLQPIGKIKANEGYFIKHYEKGTDLIILINETLAILEYSAGVYGYINIKYMIPSYESCLYNYIR